MKMLWLAVLLFLMSCASAEEYPQNWPTLRIDAACFDIVGVYENGGEVVFSGEIKSSKVDKSLPQLSDLLLQTPKDRIAAISANFVEITRHDSVLEVRALNDSGVLISVQYAENLLRCENGWLVVTIKSGMPYGAVGHEESSAMLHSATDGSLVVKRLSKATGVTFYVVPIPFSDSSTRYMRFHKRQ